MDTDHVPPAKREYFFRETAEWLSSEYCTEHENAYVLCRLAGRAWDATNSCYKARKAYDKRTPGFFKIVFTGSGFVGLYSKPY